MRTVLIGFADALAAPEVFFSLHHKGMNVRVFQRKGALAPVARFLPVGEPLLVTAPEDDSGKAVADLAEHLRAHPEIDVVLALDDTGLWLANEALAGLGEGEARPALANATGPQKEIALDKARQIAAAEAAGLSVPPTLVAETREDIFQATIFPAIVKPARAISLDASGTLKKGDAFYLFEAKDLETLPPEDAMTFPMLVQPLIHGAGEGIFGFAGEGGISHLFAHRRVRMMNPHGSGASACRSVAPAPDLVEKVKTFVSSIGWRGPFMVELLTDDDGTGWFIELNGRLWGSTALSRRSGLDYPGWAVEQALDPDFVPKDVPVVEGHQQVRHLGRELLHLLFVIKGPKSRFHAQRWPNLLRSLFGVFALHALSRFYNYDPAFPGFFLREALATVKKTIRKRKG